jgi:hypothetical protein
MPMEVRRHRTRALVAIFGALLAVGASASVPLSRGLGTERGMVATQPHVERVGALRLAVPHAAGAIVLDGDVDEPGWTPLGGAARTGGFVLPRGVPGRPYSDARLVWGDGYLYVALYAADEDIRSVVESHDGPLWLGDSFHMVFARDGKERTIDVSPTGTVTDALRPAGGLFDYSWESGAHVSTEVDGTVNLSSDADEEWVIEMAIPLDSLGMRSEPGEATGFSVQRCDAASHGARVCAGWVKGELELAR